jgi:hypothetical protein
MKDHFRSDLRAGEVTAPELVVHGENDFVVPIELGKSLYGLISYMASGAQFGKVAISTS